MVRFACLVCKVKFTHSVGKDENGNDISGEIPVLTVCGHYFHLECLMKSFASEREKVKYKKEVPLSPEEMSKVYIQRCPFAKCRQNLDDTKVTKIKVRDDEKDDSEQTILKLQGKIRELQEQLEISKRFQIGHSVSYRSSKTGKEKYGSVSKILAEIHVHGSATQQIESFSNEVTSTTSSTIKAHRNSSRLSGGSFVTVPVDLVSPFDPSMLGRKNKEEKANKTKEEKSKKELGHNSNEFETMQPKWAAGDRIYFTKEKEFATIKWIGNRQYKFMVAIEYDRAVGDDKFVSDDLPFLIERGYGRQLTLEELHTTAQKVNPNSPRAFFNSIVRWKTVRRRPQNPMFFVERSQSSS